MLLLPLGMPKGIGVLSRGELPLWFIGDFRSHHLHRLEEEIARRKKNQERRLHRKNAKIVKEGGTPLQLNRQVKPDTTVSHSSDR